MQLAAHVINSLRRVRLLLLLLVGRKQFQQPRVIAFVLEEELAILRVPLRQHEHVLECALPDQVIGVRDKNHEHLHRGQELNLIVVIDHHRLEEP